MRDQMQFIYPVITLYQPWATWIMRGWKTIETRTHNRFASLLNKTILIHAGMTTDDSDYAVKNPYLTLEQIIQEPEEMINGYILGSARVKAFGQLSSIHSDKALIDCENTLRFGLYLSEVLKYVQPVKEKGEMGIWYYDLYNKRKVKKPAHPLQGKLVI